MTPLFDCPWLQLPYVSAAIFSVRNVMTSGTHWKNSAGSCCSVTELYISETRSHLLRHNTRLAHKELECIPESNTDPCWTSCFVWGLITMLQRERERERETAIKNIIPFSHNVDASLRNYLTQGLSCFVAATDQVHKPNCGCQLVLWGHIWLTCVQDGCYLLSRVSFIAVPTCRHIRLFKMFRMTDLRKSFPL